MLCCHVLCCVVLWCVVLFVVNSCNVLSSFLVIIHVMSIVLVLARMSGLCCVYFMFLLSVLSCGVVWRGVLWCGVSW